jgi:hypothetical protein
VVIPRSKPFIRNHRGLFHPCLAEGIPVEPAIFLFDAEDLALASEVGFGEYSPIQPINAVDECVH